ncbi:MAG: hypothetical protein AB1505_19565 [Candidatus Latescibacterota bacterium]
MASLGPPRCIRVGGSAVPPLSLRRTHTTVDLARLGWRPFFAEIESLAATCRFADCQHGLDPGCAVQRALRGGRLDPGRAQSYLKLKQELAALRQRGAHRQRLVDRARRRKIDKRSARRRQRIYGRSCTREEDG